MPSVLILTEVVKRYRVPFFEALGRALAERGVTLRVAFGNPQPAEATKGDNVALPAPLGVHVRNRWLFGGRALCQPVLRLALGADLVVLEHQNRHLVNHLLLFTRCLHRKKLAFWGHGENRQGGSGGLLDWYKERTLGWVDWWFAYTAGTAEYLTARGVPKGRITVTWNSTDTAAFRAELDAVTGDELADARAALGLSPGSRVGLFCGALYPDKRVGFLLDAARRVKARVPGFELLVVGGGPDEPILAEAARRLPWVHAAGPRFGRDKAACFRLAKVFLSPGASGLAVLDAFAAGLPFVTTDLPIHGPEIEYAAHGVNALLCTPDPDCYAAEVSRLLGDPGALAALSAGAREAGGLYTLEAMVEAFAGGVLRCLGMAPAGSGEPAC